MTIKARLGRNASPLPMIDAVEMGLAEKVGTNPWSAWATDRLGTLTSRAQISRPLPSAFGERVGTTPSTPYGWKAGWGYRESSPGLTHIGHRMYDPTTGRFLTRDPILAGSNHFAYCDNDPLNAVDPTGLRDITSADLARLGALLEHGQKNEIPLSEMRKAIKYVYNAIDKVKQGDEDPANLRALWWAIDHLGSEDYGYERNNKKYQCNNFVYDAYLNVGCPMPDRSNMPGVQKYPANDLASNKSLPHLYIVSKGQPGDIVSFKTENKKGNTTPYGHTTLLVGGQVLIYAGRSTIKLGTVNENMVNRTHRNIRRHKGRS